MGLRKCGHQVFNANCAACHAGGQNSVVADHTLEKAAIEKYLTGGFKESSVSTQVQSLPRLNLTSSRFRESACPPCSAMVSSVSTHVTTAGVRQAADSSILPNEEIPFVGPNTRSLSTRFWFGPLFPPSLTSNNTTHLMRGTLPTPYPYSAHPQHPSLLALYRWPVNRRWSRGHK